MRSFRVNVCIVSGRELNAFRRYTVTRISIEYMLFSVITQVYVRHFAWYLVSKIS